MDKRPVVIALITVTVKETKIITIAVAQILTIVTIMTVALVSHAAEITTTIIALKRISQTYKKDSFYILLLFVVDYILLFDC